LKNTKQFCTENKITTLALPKICTGLDKKQWDIISNMIQFIDKFCRPASELLVLGKALEHVVCKISNKCYIMLYYFV
jgi:hypothetical protein